MPSPTGEAQVTLQATKALPYQPFGFGNWESLFPPQWVHFLKQENKSALDLYPALSNLSTNDL